mgnify:CR=1 FL=1
MDAKDITQLVRSELDRIADQRLLDAIAPLLVAPHREDRDWDYGAIRQTHPCWIVLVHSPSNTGIAYCSEASVLETLGAYCS